MIDHQINVTHVLISRAYLHRVSRLLTSLHGLPSSTICAQRILPPVLMLRAAEGHSQHKRVFAHTSKYTLSVSLRQS